MRCPFCGHEDTVVKDSRPSLGQADIKRRRLCMACKSRFSTVERIQLRELMVLKQDGQVEIFDQEKLIRSLSRALHKRSFSTDEIECAATALRRQLELGADGEIPTHVIGEKILETLLEMDPVAYVRFASIYKDFKSVQDFKQLLQKIENDT